MDKEIRSYHFRRANWQYFLVKFYIYLGRMIYVLFLWYRRVFLIFSLPLSLSSLSLAVLSLGVNGILLYSLISVLIFLFLSLSNFVPSDGTTIDIFWWNTRAHYCNRNGLYVKPDSFFQTYILHVPLIMSFDVNEALEFFSTRKMVITQRLLCFVRSTSDTLKAVDSLKSSDAYMRQETVPWSAQIMASRLIWRF